VIYEREFFSQGADRWVLRLDRKMLGLTVVCYADNRQEGSSIPFEEYFAMGTGPAHDAFIKLVESLVPETPEFAAS
jgi:hypothetical protein